MFTVKVPIELGIMNMVEDVPKLLANFQQDLAQFSGCRLLIHEPGQLLVEKRPEGFLQIPKGMGQHSGFFFLALVVFCDLRAL